MDQEQFRQDQNVSELAESAALALLSKRRKLANSVLTYQELLMRYTCAMKEIQTKFEVLNTEYNVRFRRNPIVSIHTRLKQTSSIMGKLERMGVEFSLDSIENNLHDVAGVRVICSYLDDVYTIAQALTCQDDVHLVRMKDYIKSPKENGYRSLHLIVSVPVFFAEMRRDMQVEVQIRTVAMDYWAELEHQLRYKQEIPNEEEIVRELTDCAQKTAEIDSQMLAIRKKIESGVEKPTEDEILIEKLKRLDLSIG